LLFFFEDEGNCTFGNSSSQNQQNHHQLISIQKVILFDDNLIQ